jgi:HEPN domain-containing protein
MNRELIEYVQQWLIKADEDMLVVNKLTDGEFVANASVCFHLQQATEKYLKAFLIAYEVEFKRTHNIEYLLALCAELEPVFLEIDPVNLSEFGVAIRYPGDHYEPSDKEVVQYKSIAMTVGEMVKQRLAGKLKM